MTQSSSPLEFSTVRLALAVRQALPNETYLPEYETRETVAFWTVAAVMQQFFTEQQAHDLINGGQAGPNGLSISLPADGNNTVILSVARVRQGIRIGIRTALQLVPAEEVFHGIGLSQYEFECPIRIGVAENLDLVASVDPQVFGNTLVELLVQLGVRSQ